MDVLGLPVTFVDLAGLRDTDDAVESIGVARARSRMERADLRVVLLGPGDTMKDIVERPSEDDIILQAKADLGLNSGMPGVSGLTGEGVEALLERVHAVLVERGSDTGVLSHARHKAVLAEGCARLSAAIEGLRAEEPMELVAEDMRAAIRAVDKLVGKVDIEDVLGSIFGRFCIGK
jgi:tRNA modification GTPase